MDDRLAWVDMEFSGLDHKKDVILEIATLITDKELDIVAVGPTIAVHHPEKVLERMDDWNRRHHRESGLTARVRQSKETHKSAEEKTLDFLSEHLAAAASPMCGNSVYQDRIFMKQHMPKLEAFFHYRNIDVSSVKELARRWYPGLPEYRKQQKHQAMEDIRESVGELKYYREKIFLRI